MKARNFNGLHFWKGWVSNDAMIMARPVLRESESNSEIEPETSSTLISNETPRSPFILGVVVSQPIVGNSKESQLLEKMLGAISILPEQFQVESPRVGLEKDYENLLWLGEEIAPKANDCFVSPTLEAMLLNPSLKKQAWEVLQKLQKQIQSGRGSY